jgi:two-component system, cell cycle sensor histidine kinase and response regulator CckA
MLAVSDTGIGMDSETKKHLFEPFFTTKEKDKGTGLGLSIVYGIVEQHAGGMQVLSELTQGATFKVYLPAALAEDPREQLPFVTAVPGHNTGRVLLVEDEDIVRNLVSEVLRDQGFLVLEAATPLMAIQVAKDFGSSIDLLLTDVIMPGMRGPELAALVTRQHPETKVVFMSGYPHSASEDVPQAEIAYLQKPFTATELISTLRNALSGNPQ